MKHLFLLFIVTFSSTLFAQSQYRCQLSTGGCGHNGGRYGHYLFASDRYDAISKCKDVAWRINDRFCKVESVPFGNNGRQYRCQLTTNFCGHNGGRYGHYLHAVNRREAVSKCKNIARRTNDSLCMVTSH